MNTKPWKFGPLRMRSTQDAYRHGAANIGNLWFVWFCQRMRTLAIIHHKKAMEVGNIKRSFAYAFAGQFYHEAQQAALGLIKTERVQ